MQVYLLIHYTIIRITRKFIHCTNYLIINMIRNSEAMYTQKIMKKLKKKMNRKQITHSSANFNDISDQTTTGHWTMFMARNTSDSKRFLKQFFKIFLFFYLKCYLSSFTSYTKYLLITFIMPVLENF